MREDTSEVWKNDKFKVTFFCTSDNQAELDLFAEIASAEINFMEKGEFLLQPETKVSFQAQWKSEIFPQYNDENFKNTEKLDPIEAVKCASQLSQCEVVIDLKLKLTKMEVHKI